MNPMQDDNQKEREEKYGLHTENVSVVIEEETLRFLALIEALKTGHSIIKNLKIRNMAWEKRGVRLNDTKARVLAKAFRHNASLITLDLSSNKITDVGAKAIAKAFKHNTSLKTLDLSGNEIGAGGVEALIDLLQHNTSLRTLDLSYNLIGHSGADIVGKSDGFGGTYAKLSRKRPSPDIEALAEVFQHNTSLRRLDLTGNLINVVERQLFAEALEENHTLTELKFGVIRNVDLRLISQIKTSLRRNELYEAFRETREILTSPTLLKEKKEKHEEFEKLVAALASSLVEDFNLDVLKKEAREMIVDFYQQEISTQLEEDFFKALLSVPTNFSLHASMLIVMLDCLNLSLSKDLENYRERILAELDCLPKSHPDYEEAQFALTNYYLNLYKEKSNLELSEILHLLVHAEKCQHGYVDAGYQALISYFNSKDENQTASSSSALLSSPTPAEERLLKMFKILIFLAAENKDLMAGLELAIGSHDFDALSGFFSKTLSLPSSQVPILNLLIDAKNSHHEFDEEGYFALISYFTSGDGVSHASTMLDKETLLKIFKMLILAASKNSNLLAVAEKICLIVRLGLVIENRETDGLLTVFLENTVLLKPFRSNIKITDVQLQDLADLMVASPEEERRQKMHTNQRFFLPSTSTQQAVESSEEKVSLNRDEIKSLIWTIIERFNQGKITQWALLEKMAVGIKTKNPLVLKELLVASSKSSPAP